jgi:hypothetical protein
MPNYRTFIMRKMRAFRMHGAVILIFGIIIVIIK